VQGAEIDVRSIVVGDETMSVLEIWGAEYQEQVFVSSKFGVSNL
jgi:phosphoribosylformylglycinamidine (FGAM) synthase-like enzyme